MIAFPRIDTGAGGLPSCVHCMSTEPPHEVIATREMDFGDLRRAEVFAAAAAKVYRAKVG